MPVQDLGSLVANSEVPAFDSSLDPSVNPIGFPIRVFRSYKRRWYILMVYSLAGMYQGYLWNMWGPIYGSMKAAYGWHKTQLALLPFYGNIILAFLALPSALLLEKWGLRRIILLMTFLTAVGAAIRCVPTDELGTNILINFSAVIIGAAGIVTFFLPPFISARWFPMNERKFATAIGILLNGLGMALAFIVGPSLVWDPKNDHPSETEKRKIRDEYRVYAYIETGFTVSLFLTALAYYPDKPPSPPSESADVARIDYFAGCKRLAVPGDFWLLCAPITLLFGTYSAFWLPILPIDLKGQNIDQVQAGWIGFYASVSGAVFGILTGKLGDYCGNLKAILLACCLLCIQGSVWIALIMHGFLPFSLAQTNVAAVILGSAGSSLLPINCELAAEMCYPVDEAIVVALMGVVCNIPACIESIVLFFPIGTDWVDWFLAACCIATLPFIAVIREKYKRSDVDTGEVDSVD